MSTGVSSPCFSTCAGRPGENTRSLMPSPTSSIVVIMAAASFDGASASGAPNSSVSIGLISVSGVGISLTRWRALDELNAIAGRIDCDADHRAGVAERAGIAGHRPAGGLDGGHGGRHVGDVEDHVRDRVFQIVRVAMHENDRLAPD